MISCVAHSLGKLADLSVKGCESFLKAAKNPQKNRAIMAGIRSSLQLAVLVFYYQVAIVAILVSCSPLKMKQITQGVDTRLTQLWSKLSPAKRIGLSFTSIFIAYIAVNVLWIPGYILSFKASCEIFQNNISK